MLRELWLGLANCLFVILAAARNGSVAGHCATPAMFGLVLGFLFQMGIIRSLSRTNVKTIQRGDA